MLESSHYNKWLHKRILLKKIVVFIEDSRTKRLDTNGKKKISPTLELFHSSFLQNQMETSYECMTTCKNPTCTDKRLVKSCLTLDYRISMTKLALSLLEDVVRN